MQAPLIIAHRGDSSRGLENSLEAIRLALSIPVDMIEIDLRKSRDDVIYVMHDKKTGRTAEQDVDIEHSLSREIAGIRLNNGEHIPTLQDVLALVAGKTALNLEIKSKGAGELTARHLISSGYFGKVMVSSFLENEVLMVRRLMPKLPACLIYDILPARAIPAYKAKGYSIVSLRKKAVNEKVVLACHKHDIQMYLWTVDEEKEMKKFIAWGVGGLYSNTPMVLKEVIDGLVR